MHKRPSKKKSNLRALAERAVAARREAIVEVDDAIMMDVVGVAQA